MVGIVYALNDVRHCLPCLVITSPSYDASHASNGVNTVVTPEKKERAQRVQRDAACT
jgi:hypothetical protein